MPKKPETIQKYQAVKSEYKKLLKQGFTVGQTIDKVLKKYKITFGTFRVILSTKIVSQ